MVNTPESFTCYNNSGILCLEVLNLKIAIVDDQEKDRDELKNVLIPYLNTLDLETDLCEYESAEDFLGVFEKDEFDICFMDIYLKKMDGMTAARHLADQDPNCFIIFLTTSPDYMAEGYDVRAWRYIVKPLQKDMIHKILGPCLEQIVQSRRYLHVRSDRQELDIPYSRIYYIITSCRNTIIHTSDIQITVSSRTSFSELTQPLLKDYRFFCCNRGILVNLTKIKRMEKDTLTLQNGEQIPVSRNKIRDTKSAFLQVAFERV